ncbi:MAG: twin-arginine translocation signal domain-containing protein [Phycisphaerales bacterium]|nr:twin-arginine translocation signal domain-containing protein [Phycisphaerales bacterium]
MPEDAFENTLSRRHFLVTSAMLAAAGGLGGLADSLGQPQQHQTPQAATTQQQLAILELRRYIYLRTGRQPVITGNIHQLDAAELVVGDKTNAAVAKLCAGQAWQQQAMNLGPQEYLLQSMLLAGKPRVLIVGGDSIGTLYGAYRFIELLGVRFYLHGDVIPDDRLPWPLPSVSERGKPLFNLRGIQPFHDFPEGPDWWNQQDYLAIIGQLPKMRMNFIGLHCYPAGPVGPEPAVWIGPHQDITPSGSVTASYPAAWANTARNGMWGFASIKTDQFCAGAALLFDHNTYGPDVMQGLMPEPTTPTQCNELFNRVGLMFQAAFSWAKRCGIKTCLGTETPLAIPPAVRLRLKAAGLTPADIATVEKLYEGIFTRVARACPTDYYWLWMPESWTWEGNSPQQCAAVVGDVQAALRALAATQSHIKLATCGWVLGPQGNRAALDRVLPKDVPLSAISRDIGNTPLDTAFAAIHGRDKWAIPWLENDPHLTAPQPYAGRMRFDALAAHRYGCTGLFGIHWRTKAVAPNIAALAAAGWDQSWAPSNVSIASISHFPNPQAAKDRSMPIDDFYLDYAAAHFGPNVAKEARDIFCEIDGPKMPRSVTWMTGPGDIPAQGAPWSSVRRSWTFVDRFAAIAPRVMGRSCQERFLNQLNTFRYAREQAHLGCLRASLDSAVQKLLNKTIAPAQRQRQLKQALAIRLKLTRHWVKMLRYQLAAVSTRGELGTLANLEQHTRTRDQFLNLHDTVLQRELGHALPESANPVMTYQGEARLIVPTLRTSIQRGESLELQVLILSDAAESSIRGSLMWRPLAEETFKPIALEHIRRRVYRAKLPPMPKRVEIFEYYIQADTGTHTLSFPPSAPQQNQTVVVVPA